MSVEGKTGDLYATVRIVLPEKATTSSTELMRQNGAITSLRSAREFQMTMDRRPRTGTGNWGILPPPFLSA